MKYTVQFTEREVQHTNGLYEDFEHAKAVARGLVEGEADCSWVEFTEHPELKTPPFIKPKPLPVVVPSPVVVPKPQARTKR